MHCFYYIFPCFKIGRYDASPIKVQYMRHGSGRKHKVRKAHKILKARKQTRLAIQ